MSDVRHGTEPRWARARYGLLLCGACVALSAVAACRTPSASRKPPPAPPLLPDRVSVEPGDVLEIEVFGEKSLSGKFQVSDAGTIDYPLVGRVKVAGGTPPAVAKDLRERLADGYLRNPHVAVFAEGYAAKKQVYVWGEVRKSGAFKYTGNMTIIRAITLAEGLTPLADKNGITLTRIVDGKEKQYTVPMGDGQSSNQRLKPGDVVFVPERVF